MALPARLLLACLLLTALGTGCSGRGGPAAAGPVDDRPMPSDPAERVRWALADTRSPERRAALTALQDSLRDDVNPRLASIVEDTAAHPVVRANAVVLLGERRGLEELRAFWTALESPDVRVRAAAAGALRGIVVANEERGLRLVRRALRDPEPIVQARALEAVGDGDAGLLREYLASEPPADLAKVAADLIRIAEERGAPLTPAAGAAGQARAGVGDAPSGDAATAVEAAGSGGTGVALSRTAASGPQLEFRALRSWPRWEAAVGELIVTPPGKDPIRISSEVEVVAGVVPAFFSVDGRYLVYEAGREIRVRDLSGGEDRVLGSGIAPRVIPFSPWFVFLRERPEERDVRRDVTSVVYEVLRAAFQGGEPASLGRRRATLRMDEHGYYSPARWMRVRERDGVFTLESEAMERFVLPDPFTAFEGDR